MKRSILKISKEEREERLDRKKAARLFGFRNAFWCRCCGEEYWSVLDLIYCCGHKKARDVRNNL